MHFLMFIVIGLIAGALAGRVVSGHGYGLLGDIILGGVGASGFVVSLIMAFVGATVLLWLIRLIAPLRA